MPLTFRDLPPDTRLPLFDAPGADPVRASSGRMGPDYIRIILASPVRERRFAALVRGVAVMNHVH